MLEKLYYSRSFNCSGYFPTETAGYADVILPVSAFPEKSGTFTNSNRQVQLGRQAIDPPGMHVRIGG